MTILAWLGTDMKEVQWTKDREDGKLIFDGTIVKQSRGNTEQMMVCRPWTNQSNSNLCSPVKDYNFTLTQDPKKMYETYKEQHHFKSIVLPVLWFTSFVLLILSIIFYLYIQIQRFRELAREKREGTLTGDAVNAFMREVEKYLDLLLLVIASAFLISPLFSSVSVVTHLAAFSIILVWLRVTVMIGWFPTFGVYIHMSVYIFHSMVIFFSLYIFTLIGFAIALYILLPTTNAFSSPISGLLKTLVMMVGEYQFEDFFYLGKSPRGNRLENEYQR